MNSATRSVLCVLRRSSGGVMIIVLAVVIVLGLAGAGVWLYLERPWVSACERLEQRCATATQGMGLSPMGRKCGALALGMFFAKKQPTDAQCKELLDALEGKVAMPAGTSEAAAANPKAQKQIVEKNLDLCVQACIDYFDKPRLLANGKTVSCLLPPEMKKPACPGDLRPDSPGLKVASFTNKAYSQGGKAEVLGLVGFKPKPSAACYQITSTSPGKQPGRRASYTCHAWTDLDGDGKTAHWTRTARYEPVTGSFKLGPFERDLNSDDL